MHPPWRRWWIPIIVLGIIVGWVYIGRVPRASQSMPMGQPGQIVPEPGRGPDGQPCVNGDC